MQYNTVLNIRTLKKQPTRKGALPIDRKTTAMSLKVWWHAYACVCVCVCGGGGLICLKFTLSSTKKNASPMTNGLEAGAIYVFIS